MTGGDRCSSLGRRRRIPRPLVYLCRFIFLLFSMKWRTNLSTPLARILPLLLPAVMLLHGCSNEPPAVAPISPADTLKTHKDSISAPPVGGTFIYQVEGAEL